jgi:hypothetical protein
MYEKTQTKKMAFSNLFAIKISFLEWVLGMIYKD